MKFEKKFKINQDFFWKIDQKNAGKNDQNFFILFY